MSEPMVSYDNVGFYLLSQEVAKHIKVVQSGQGADEVFGGYHWYPPLVDSNDIVGDYARVFFDRSHDAHDASISRPTGSPRATPAATSSPRISPKPARRDRSTRRCASTPT